LTVALQKGQITGQLRRNRKVPLSEDQSDAVRRALKNTGINVEYLILDADTRSLKRTDTVGYLDWSLANGEDRISVQIALDEMGDVRVSTVFISATIINGNDWMAKTPFETMVFDNGRNLGMTRKYASLEEAETGHGDVVAEVLQRIQSLRPGGWG
jgi:hypothetical protein